MFYLHPGLALMTIIVIPIQIVVFMLVQNKLQQYSNVFVQTRSKLTGKLSEYISGTVTIRALQVEDYCQNRLEKHMDTLYDNQYKMGMLGTFLSMASWMLILVPFQAIMYGVGGTWYFNTGAPSIGLMLAFANYGNSLVGPIMTLVNFSRDLVYASSCIEQIEDFNRKDLEENIQEVQNVDRPNALVQQQFLDADVCEINVRCMEIFYEDKDIARLNDLNFMPSTISLLYGKSGCGKSSFLKSLFKLQDFRGEVYFNNLNLADIPVQDLRSRISYIEQNPFFFSGSVRENLTMFDRTIQDAQIVSALKQVNLDFLAADLDQMLKGGGDNLSGGEKMRLAIARAILEDSMIMLVDEPTASLDAANSRSVLKVFDKLKHNKTILISSHDPLSRQIADQCIDMENYVL